MAAAAAFLPLPASQPSFFAFPFSSFPSLHAPISMRFFCSCSPSRSLFRSFPQAPLCIHLISPLLLVRVRVRVRRLGASRTGVARSRSRSSSLHASPSPPLVHAPVSCRCQPCSSSDCASPHRATSAVDSCSGPKHSRTGCISLSLSVAIAQLELQLAAPRPKTAAACHSKQISQHGCAASPPTAIDSTASGRSRRAGPNAAAAASHCTSQLAVAPSRVCFRHSTPS